MQYVGSSGVEEKRDGRRFVWNVDGRRKKRREGGGREGVC